MRIISSELLKHVGHQVTVEGWLHKRRDLGGIVFLVVRDRGGLVQVVVRSEEEQAKLTGLQVGTVLRVAGECVEEKRAKGGVEIYSPELTVITPVTEVPPIEIDKPIDHTSENFDTLFENRAYNLRNVEEGMIFRLRAELNRYIREHLWKGGFTEIQTPKLLAGATEGGAEVFKLDYFGQEATLAQSPQFYKQMLVGAFERVFEVGAAYRAEPSVTTRHLSELVMLDVEVGFIEKHGDVLDVAQGLLYEVVTRVYEEHADWLKAVGAPELVLKREFPRYSVKQIHEMYTEATGESTLGEKDLRPAEERWICEYARVNEGCEAVFVTGLPVEAMKFYHMVDPDDPRVALSADMLFRGLELATAPMREHRHEKLLAQMVAAGLDVSAAGYKYYLEAFRAGLPPHGGFGFGIDRLAQTVCGLDNVKEAVMFPRDTRRLTP